jgi:hypothetical protein
MAGMRDHATVLVVGAGHIDLTLACHADATGVCPARAVYDVG